jgi:anti-anti-sigma factor
MTTDMVEVRLVAVPVDVWRDASAHQEAVQRELDIIRPTLDETAVPNRFQQLVTEFDARYGQSSEGTWGELHAAAERGEQSVDLTFVVARDTAEAARLLDQMLDEVDEFCRAGDRLLTLATPEPLVAFRRWLLGEFTRQIDLGLAPLPWHRYSEQGTAPGKVEAIEPSGERDTIRFTGDLDISTAGALRDEILSTRTRGISRLTIDLSEVEFMDSVGISLLVTAHNRAKEDGVELDIVFPRRLQPLIEMTGLIDLLRPTFVERSA